MECHAATSCGVEYLHGAVAVILDGFDLNLPATHGEYSLTFCDESRAVDGGPVGEQPVVLRSKRWSWCKRCLRGWLVKEGAAFKETSRLVLRRQGASTDGEA